MSKKEEHTGLSSEDAALWEKVTRTLSSFGSKKSGKKEKSSSKKQSIDSSDTVNEASEQPSNSDEFSALLSEQENQDQVNQEIEPETKKPVKNHTKKNQIPTPTREDFAALLNDPNAVISTDSAQEKNAVARPTSGGLLNPKSADALWASEAPKSADAMWTSEAKKSEPKPFMPAYSPAMDQNQNKNSQPTIESFNQRDARNISSGKQTIDAAIDLHGFTQAQAETALKTFLKRAHLDNKRTVLVITGKGQRRKSSERSFELGAPEPGILKRSVPNWIDDMPDIVLSYTTSHIKHGGEGALYVRLRRAVKPSK